MDENLDFANFYHIYPPLAIHGWKAMDLTVNLAPSYRDLKDPTSRQNFYDTVEQKCVIDLRPCHMYVMYICNGHMYHVLINTKLHTVYLGYLKHFVCVCNDGDTLSVLLPHRSHMLYLVAEISGYVTEQDKQIKKGR